MATKTATKKRTRFRPVTAHDVTDLQLLPRRFDRFTADVKSEFKLLGEKILPFMERMEHAIADLAIRQTASEQALHRLEDRVAALEAAKPSDSK